MADKLLARAFLETIPRAMWMIRAEMRQVAKSDLTVPQFRILAHLSMASATNVELAERMGNSAPSMCRMVAALVNRGYVRQTREAKDRRLVRLELTPKGRAKFESIRKRTQERIDEGFKNLGDERRQVLKAALNVINEVVGQP